MRLFYKRLLPTTASHRTWSYHELCAGKRPEIGFLNGATAAVGKFVGVNPPANCVVTEAIKNR